MTTGEIVIRVAEPSDSTACALLISDHESGAFEDWRSRFEIDLANPRRLFLVATVDDSVLGYGHTTFHSRDAHEESTSSPSGYFLSGLMVSPDYRRKGIGKFLTIARINKLRQVTDHIYYGAERGNLATIDLHAQLGFENVGSVLKEGEEFSLFRSQLHPGKHQ
ncbi:MAG TPA: GNAT family N-acetyltransferase [Acidimicrobiales bacterium]